MLNVYAIYLLKCILIKHSQFTIYLCDFVILMYIKYLSIYVHTNIDNIHTKMFLLALQWYYLTDGLSRNREVGSVTGTPLLP